MRHTCRVAPKFYGLHSVLCVKRCLDAHKNRVTGQPKQMKPEFSHDASIKERIHFSHPALTGAWQVGHIGSISCQSSSDINFEELTSPMNMNNRSRANPGESTNISFVRTLQAPNSKRIRQETRSTRGCNCWHERFIQLVYSIVQLNVFEYSKLLL